MRNPANGSCGFIPPKTTDCLDKVYLDENLKSGKTKYKNSYTIREFESLVKNMNYQESYWACMLLTRLGAELDPNLMEIVRESVETHWPDICGGKR